MSFEAVQTRISGDRLWARLCDMARFGGTADGGVNRPALSEAEMEARAQLVEWGRSIGLQPFTDAIGNLFLRIQGQRDVLPPVLTGSHIDSQPTGGRYDGVYGVVAALEAVQAIVESGLDIVRPVEIVAWTNEEGSRFAPGMNGSTAFCAPETLPQILAIRDASGTTVADAVRRVLERDRDVPLRPLGRAPCYYIEPHIEQAKELEKTGIPVGVVTGIQGTRRYRVRITGKAGHAGTEPMRARRDALLAAAGAISALEAEALLVDDLKLTVGLFQVTPNAPSVIPEEVYFSIDVRHPDDAAVGKFHRSIQEILGAVRRGCRVHCEQIAWAPSLHFSSDIQARIARAAAALEIPSMSVYSAAGHDARQLNGLCPSGMIFIPCRDGLSHSPAEWIEPEHALAGAQVLAQVIAELASA